MNLDDFRTGEIDLARRLWDVAALAPFPWERLTDEVRIEFALYARGILSREKQQTTQFTQTTQKQ